MRSGNLLFRDLMHEAESAARRKARLDPYGLALEVLELASHRLEEIADQMAAVEEADTYEVVLEADRVGSILIRVTLLQGRRAEAGVYEEICARQLAEPPWPELCRAQRRGRRAGSGDARRAWKRCWNSSASKPS